MNGTDYGTCEYEGETYELLHEAHVDYWSPLDIRSVTGDPEDDGTVFTAIAVKVGEREEDGYRMHYRLIWTLTDRYRETVANSEGCWVDDGDACEWDKPYDVVELALY